jgi:hypothetical protein
MSDDKALFEAMLKDLYSGGDFEQNWRLYRTADGKSADGLASRLWNSMAPVPQRLLKLTGLRAKTLGELVQRVRPSSGESADDARHRYDAFETPAKRCRDVGKPK